ncbi:MAG: choice-of-anchor J domain-containing protein [Muribaculaceae bacterium]|nr:choice-of-anchor J domain-containing protein [Muribaculaceae bacterium]
MKKLLTFLTLLTLSIGVGWATNVTERLTNSEIGVTGSNYTDWSYSFDNGVTYCGQSASNNYGEFIQLRTKNSNSGIVSTTTIGTIKRIAITWYSGSGQDNSNKSIDIYGKNTAYDSPSDLYSTSTQGTKLGSIVYGESLALDVSDSYAYIGIRSNSGAVYIEEIEITWDTEGGTQTPSHDITYDEVDGGSFSGPASAAEGSTVSISATPAAGYEFDSWNVYKTGDETTTVTVSSDNKFIMPEYNVTVSGTFTEKTPYTINYTVGENGSLPSDKPTSAYSGDNVTVTTTPAEGYKLGSFIVAPTENGVTAPTVTISGNSATFTMPASNVNVNVTFEALPTYVFYEPFTGSNGENTNFGINASGDGNGNSPKYVSGFGAFTSTQGIYGANNAIKLGTSSKPGNTTTPSITGITPGKTYVLTFKAAPWASETASMSVTATGGTLTGLSTSNMTNGQWNEYSATFVANSEGTRDGVTFTFTASKNRFFLDEVMLDVVAETGFEIKRTIKTNGEDNNEAGGWIGDWSSNCSTPNGISGNHYTVTAPAGETVQFKAGTNNNYKILESHVSAVDDNNTAITLTKVSSDNSGIVFSFTMPASEVTITANFTDYYHPTLRMAGRFNGRPESAWITNSSGPAFTFDEDKDEYTINAYFTGAVNNNNQQIDYFFLRADENNLMADASGDCWVGENGGTYNLGGSSNFRIYPGVYKITVNGSRKQAVITKVTPELSFNYPAGEVLSGTTINATSTLTTLINDIKDNDSGAQGEVSVKVCTDGSSYNLDEVPLTSNQTVYGKAWIGNLAVTENAAYTIHEFDTETPDYTEAFSAGFGKFFADNSTIWTIYNSSCARASAYFNGAATASESWLYSPYIDLTAATNPKLSFSHAGNFFTTDGQSYMADDVKVMIRELSNNEWTDWTPLDGVTYPDGNNYNFVEFNKDMTSYVNKTIQIAFKYTSTTSRAGTWEIKNFKVAELYNITCNTADNGSITASPNPATAGETVTITVTPASGYELATLVYNDGTDHDIKATKSFTMPAANVTVTATFAEKQVGTDEFHLVTYDSNPLPLVAGYEYIIVTEDYNWAMGAIDGDAKKATASQDFVFIGDDHTTVALTENSTVNVIKLVDGVENPDRKYWNLTQDNGLNIFLQNTGTGIQEQTHGYGLSGYSDEVLININAANYAFITPGGRQILYQDGDNGAAGVFGHYANSNVGASGYKRVYLYYREGATVPPTEATLANLCENGEKNKSYTITDQLIAVAYAENTEGSFLWCKDQGNKSIFSTSIHEGDQIDYLYNDTQAQNKRDWDQSNWVALKFTDLTTTEANVIKGYVNSYINEKAITGELVDDNNYMLAVSTKTLTTTAGASYPKNVYCTSNFVLDNLNIFGSIAAGDGGYTGNNGQNYFFMNPKVQEACIITYAMWDAENNCFTVPSNSGFEGNVSVNLAYNENPYLDLSESLTDKKVYQFEAIVNRSSKNAYGPKANRADEFTVYPTNLTGGNENNPPTAISTVDMGNGVVKSVKYLNVAGMVSDTPFQGVNIVVTEYTDGTRTATKMLRK